MTRVAGDVVDAAIGQIADLHRGITYKKPQSSTSPAPGLVPILRATNIGRELVFEDLVYVPKDLVSEQQLLRRGDIVIAASSGSRSVVGKAAPMRHEWTGSFGAFCYMLRPRSGLADPLYVAYFLQTTEYRSEVSRLAAGVNINNLKREHLEQLGIPLVSLSRQRRTVEAIESCLSRLEDAAAGLERVQRNLQRYRASVLQAAVEGRLVSTEAELARAEGRDYEPASELLKRILAARRRRWEQAELKQLKARGRTPTDDRWKTKYKEPTAPDTSDLPSLPEGWCWASVQQISSAIQYGYTASALARDDGPRFLRITDIQDGRVHWHEVPSCEIESPDIEKYRLNPGDLVFARTGATTGKSFLIGECPDAVFASYLIRLRAMAFMAASYVYLFFQTTTYWHQIEAGKRGIGQPNVNANTLGRMAIPVPPTDEQERIVAEAERLLSNCQSASETVRLQMGRCERLRHSILSWAFEGRLVDQEPGDEPAAALLERIRQSRQTEVGQFRKGRRRRGRAQG